MKYSKLPNSPLTSITMVHKPNKNIYTPLLSRPITLPPICSKSLRNYYTKEILTYQQTIKLYHRAIPYKHSSVPLYTGCNLHSDYVRAEIVCNRSISRCRPSIKNLNVEESAHLTSSLISRQKVMPLVLHSSMPIIALPPINVPQTQPTDCLYLQVLVKKYSLKK